MVSCTLSMVSEMLLDIDGVDLNVVELETLLIVGVVDGNVLVRSIEVVNEDCAFVSPLDVMKANVDSLGINEPSLVCLLG